MAAAVAEQQEWRVDEEEEEEPLMGRQHQYHKTPTTYAEAAMDASNAANGHGSLLETHSSSEPLVEEEQVLVAEGTFPTASYVLPETNGETKTVFISKTLLVEKNTVVASSSTTSSSSVVENGTSSVIIRETKQEEEMTEVILENVYQKPATQEFFCPNCQACIKKVILQGVDNNTSQPAPLPPRPVHNTFRCTSCFSFLIPVGNWIFGGREQDDDYDLITDQVDVHVPQGTPRDPPAATKVPSAGEVSVDQGKAPSPSPSARPPTPPPVSAPGEAPPPSASKQPASTQGVGQEVNGVHVSVTSRDPQTIGFPSGGWGDWRNKLPPLSQSEQADSGRIEVLVDDGQASGDEAINDKNKGKMKGILGLLINKLPGIGAQQIGKMDNGIADGVEDAQRPGTELPVTDEAPAPVPGSPDVVVSGEPSTTTPSTRVGSVREWDILKSIVYGGLAELITSLSIVTSAASADTDTLKILAIGIANLVGGLSLLATNISDLRCEQPRRVIVSSETQEESEVDRYCDLLGQRSNFKRHAFFAVLSFLAFGLIPPVVYGFSFKESDNKDYKIAAVAAASLLCVLLLAIGKAHVQKAPKNYFKTVLFYLTVGIMASGVSFAAGDLFKKVMDDLGWFEPVAEAPPAAASIAGMVSGMPAWGSY